MKLLIATRNAHKLAEIREMLPGVERFFREFGAKQYPFFTITKGNLSLWNRMRIKLNTLNLTK